MRETGHARHQHQLGLAYLGIAYQNLDTAIPTYRKQPLHQPTQLAFHDYVTVLRVTGEPTTTNIVKRINNKAKVREIKLRQGKELKGLEKGKANLEASLVYTRSIEPL